MLVWLKDYSKAIDNLKNIITSNKVLVLFDVRPVQIYCDAYKSVICCCLVQNGRPVYFA